MSGIRDNFVEKFQEKAKMRARIRYLQMKEHLVFGTYTCLRCGGAIPSFERIGQYPGALSRTDNKTEICSDCGSNEALECMRGLLTAQDRWAIQDVIKNSDDI